MIDGLCENCGAHLVGDYCHLCGQREIDDDWQSIGAILRHFWDELVSFDFKTAHTLVALLRPGELPAAFIAGRRRRYLGPLKVYFLCAGIFFIVGPRVSGFSLERQLAHDPDGTRHARIERRIAETHVSAELFSERFGGTLQRVYTVMPVFSVFATTLILRMLYRRSVPWLGPHMIFSLYYIAFWYLMAIPVGAVNEAFDGRALPVLAVQYGIVAPYAFFAMLRVYKEPPRVTLLKCAVLLTIAFVIDSQLNVAAEAASIALT